MKRKRKDKVTQLELGLNSPFSNSLVKLTTKVSKSMMFFDLMKFAKDPIIWILTTISVILIGIQVYLIYISIPDLPSLIPLVNYHNFDEMKLYSSQVAYAVPILSSVLVISSILLSYRWYNKEKDIIKFFIFLVFLSIIANTYHIVKLLTLY